MIKEAVLKRVRDYIRRTAGDAAEEGVRQGLKQITSDRASELIKNTIKKSIIPIAGGTAAVGLTAGIGFGIGKRISEVGVPRKVDPSTYYPPQREIIALPEQGPEFIGAREAMSLSARRL